jgi:ubiquitin C-terminal hydrolase
MRQDYEGNPTDVTVQMDANEFFNMLFDRIEACIKGSPQEKLLDVLFGGRVEHQLVSQECEHTSRREEGFFILSLEVKNKRSVLESLQLYVEGEMLEGDNKYFCAECKEKRRTLKRVCVKQLPSTLILHLKRFEFDLDSMRKASAPLRPPRY